jgi:hypothetical protein
VAVRQTIAAVATIGLLAMGLAVALAPFDVASGLDLADAARTRCGSPLTGSDPPVSHLLVYFPDPCQDAGTRRLAIAGALLISATVVGAAGIRAWRHSITRPSRGRRPSPSASAGRPA